MAHSNGSESRRLAAQEFEQSLEQLHELLGGENSSQRTPPSSPPSSTSESDRTAWEQEKEDFEAWLGETDED
ncbi:MAG: hypothetical protein F6K03_10480 [Kamptonema sp. SIO4C4]|nr:hypothetical protein [Kamptonema sp. SIO4C4]